MEVSNFVDSIDFVSAHSVQNPHELLVQADSILKDSGLKYWLSFGTILGFYRDKDIIPWDTDIDISVFVDEGQEEIVSEIVNKFANEWKYIRSVKENGLQMQSAYQREDKFIIDLSFFRTIDKRLYSYCEGGLWLNDKEVILPTKNIETKYGEFPAPSDIEVYLTTRYGGWQSKSDDKSKNNIKAL